MKTVKISDETHGKLLRVSGDIQSKSNEKITMEKAIIKLLGRWKSEHSK